MTRSRRPILALAMIGALSAAPALAGEASNLVKVDAATQAAEAWVSELVGEIDAG